MDPVSPAGALLNNDNISYNRMLNKIDALDRAILSALVEDSSLPSKELARRLKIHPNTLLQRLKRLEKERYLLRYTAVLDFDRLGYGLQAMIFINVTMTEEWEKHLKPVSRLPQVVQFILLTGEHDALAIVRVKDKDELAEVLRKVQATGVVTKTTSHLILDYYKRSYEYNPLGQ